MKELLKKIWDKIKSIGPAIMVVVSAIFFFLGRKRGGQETIDAGKDIGKSEQKDKNREEVIEKADDQIKKNEEVIERSQNAIEEARRLRNESNN
jgi:ABC-type Fe3+-citrate transport system substrate-binding protein